MTVTGSEKAVVIGTSAGAMDALSAILPRLPAQFPLPVIIVVHLPPDKDSILPELFTARCQLVVKEAEDKELLQAGVIYFAPPNYHLLVETDHSLSLSNDEPVLFSRPSIDLLFISAADAYGPNLTGIVLTGANSDGAAGLAAIAAGGGTALVQTPSDAMAEPMPRAARAAVPTAKLLKLDDLAAYLIEAYCNERNDDGTGSLSTCG